MKNNKKNNKKNSIKKKNQTANSTGLSSIVERKEFYRDMSSAMWKIAAIGIVSLLLSVILTFIAVTKKEVNSYFATNEAGSLIEMVALAEPNHKDATVANWLTRALVDTFDFNYHNLKSRLNESSMRWFTSEGTTELIKAMDNNGSFDVIVERKIIVNFETDQVPLVVRKGRPDWSNNYLWKLEVPGKITYRTESSVFTNNVLITAIVSRKSLLEDPNGLGISSIIMTVTK